jgi:hypothetical protein
MREGPSKYAIAFKKALKNRETNPGGRVEYHAHCHRILMFVDTNFSTYVWNKQGDLWLTESNEKNYGDVIGQKNLDWLLDK